MNLVIGWSQKWRKKCADRPTLPSLKGAFRFTSSIIAFDIDSIACINWDESKKSEALINCYGRIRETKKGAWVAEKKD